jgi:P4 family phage/plasmid primase-like protien
MEAGKQLINPPGSPLTSDDLARLSNSGISAELAEAALLRRVDSAEGGQLIGRNGSGSYAGIAFVYTWPGVEGVREYRLRRDSPDLERQADGSIRERAKYLSPPGRGNLLYFVPGTEAAWLADTRLTIVVSEGEKKALALFGLAWTGLGDAAMCPRWLPIALPGVWNWRATIGKAPGPNGDRRDVKGVIADFDRVKWDGRRVLIVFDKNVRTNSSVAAARRELAKELTRRGGRVSLIDLPDVDQINGVDDLIAAWGPGRVLNLIETTATPWEPNYGRNDTGNGDRLADLFGSDLIYCDERKGLMVWSDSHWAHDQFIRAERLAEKTLLAAFAEASRIPDADDRKAFLKFLNQSLERSGISNMVHSVKRKVRLASINDFDVEPFLLNCRNGTIDLHTGSLLEHCREDLLTKCIPFDYSSGLECPTFLRFIFEIMGAGPDASEAELERAARLVAYLQKLLGCAATGVPEKILVIFYGAGNNGKTTLIEIIRAALGESEYAGEIQIDTLMAKPRETAASNAANADMADLKGLRFVSSSEAEQGHRLSLGKVKYITGLGQLRARYLCENFFNFRPTHKLFLDCNHKPNVTDPNDAVWNRVKLIPFDVEIREPDTDLPNRLRAELPGILHWIVQGAVDYCRTGIGPAPEEVSKATEAYRQESDKLSEFIEERCIVGDPKDFIPVANLYPSYSGWAEAAGDKYPVSKTVFDERLAKLGFVKGKDPTGEKRAWRGIRFR